MIFPILNTQKINISYYNEWLMLQLIAAILMIFFLPGFTFINMLFPKEGELDLEFDMLYRITLGIAMSITLSILVGFVFGSITTEGDKGYFTAGNLWISLIAITIIFFIAGYFRGAYDWVFVKFKLKPPKKEGKRAKLIEMKTLLQERRETVAEMEKWQNRTRISEKNIKKAYEDKLAEATERLKNIDREIERVKKELDFRDI